MGETSQIVSLRQLTCEDLPEAMRLKNAEGWNQTEKDWEVFLKDPLNINLIAEVRGKTAATVTAINYENKIAWLGMMIVDRAYRGMGISKKLMSTAIERLQQNNCGSIKLDATPQGRPVYVKLGFIEEYTIFRLVHSGPNLPGLNPGDTARIMQATDRDIPGIIALDADIFGAGRSDLVEHLIINNRDKSFVLKENGEITGFALGRDGTRFVQVGPVVAASEKDAEELIFRALGSLQGKAVVIDMLKDQVHTLNRLLGMGFENQRPFYRMYLENNPYPGKPENLYAICGPEFG